MSRFVGPKVWYLGTRNKYISSDLANPQHHLIRESKEKDIAAMLDELTMEANEESLVIVLQQGGNDGTDVRWKRSTSSGCFFPAKGCFISDFCP